MKDRKNGWVFIFLGTLAAGLLAMRVIYLHEESKIRLSSELLQLTVQNQKLDLEREKLEQQTQASATQQPEQAATASLVDLKLVHEVIASALKDIQVISTKEVVRSWDYAIMDCRKSDGWRPWKLNGAPFPNWEKSSVIVEARRLGEQGWELVNISHNDTSEFWVFKRPKGSS
jgi:hypothetical protein